MLAKALPWQGFFYFYPYRQMNADPKELEQFGALAHHWWDPEAEFKFLHQLNPLRLDWINQHICLEDKRIVDIGCGGGILCEAMAKLGARVTGIDLCADALSVAELHRLEAEVRVDYEAISAEALAEREPGSYDVVTCMEMLEHVPDPSAIVTACATLVRPGGWVFFSTLNRTPKSYLFAIIAAEYLLRMLPRGTHDYARFIRPSELAAHARTARLRVHAPQGLSYFPFSQRFALSEDVSINYMLACIRAC